nr:MAG TPA: hypothetical protein [Caudoviricetes sp.]
MKTTVFLAVFLIAEFFIFGIPANWNEWTHGAAAGVVGTCLFYKLAWRYYHGRE